MPKIEEVIINAGRTFNHPYESYSNLRPAVTIKATLLDGEDCETVVKDLQAKAEKLVEDHKQHMLTSLEELHDLSVYQQEVIGLEQTIKSSQQKLDRLREKAVELKPKQLEIGEFDA